MKVTTIRFSERLWAQLEEEARAEGISASQFVREAAVMRLAFNHGKAYGDAAVAEQRDEIPEPATADAG